MTREEILALSPGRELDTLVAGEVLGYPINEDWFEWCYDVDAKYHHSTNKSAAWKVVEKMRDRFSTRHNFIKELLNFMNPNPDGLQIRESELIWHINPERISKAALLAVMNL